MAVLSAYFWLLFIIQRIHGKCTTEPTTTHYSKELIYDPNTFISSSTIQITSLFSSNIYHLYFYNNQYQCDNPTLTINYQQAHSFTIQYHQDYAIKTIQCNANNCSSASCVSTYTLSNQTIASNTIYPIIINASSSINECNHVNVTLFCSNNDPTLSDWSEKTTNRFKLWYSEVTQYISYGDRPIYFSIIAVILLCICCCCCLAFIRQYRQPKNVTTHPKPKYVKPKVKKAKKLNNNNLSMDIFKSSVSVNRSSKYEAIEEKELLDMDKKGIVYLQTRYYDDKQLQNIRTAWSDNYRNGPKILFGDNYADKYRPKHKKERSKSAGQSKVIGKYDRKYGFGITTTFDDAKEHGFNFTDKNFKKLVENEFKILHKHLLNGGDVIIPYPSHKDLEQRPQKYFKNGNYNSKQIIFHNLGTGISSLSFQNLLVIQQNIGKLKKSASAVIKVKQKLYDQPYYSDDAEYESDKIIEDEIDPFFNSLSHGENVHSTSQSELNELVRGLLIFQTAWYSKKQMQHIRSQCKTKPDVRKVGKMVFGDNDADKFRAKGVKRQHFGGQASVVGYYDKLFGYGITTTFVEKDLPEINNFMLLIDQQFQPLQQHLLKGYDVVIPKPRKHDVMTNKKNYYKNGKQVIFHNIGTGIASLSFEYVSYVQQKIDELKKYARDTKTVKYYNYSANNDGLMNVNNNKHEQEIYHCPLCPEEQHYLINLTNCTHSICEQCLRSYIYQHLIYEDNPVQQRFKCWAANIGKCKGEICLNDIKYTDDRCRCEQCKHNNSDTGTDTILDVERYKQFVNIMNAFKMKSKWNKTECPECLKPFPISKPWKKKKKINNNLHDDNEGTGYDVEEDDDDDYVRKKTFFSKNMDHCNCCGEKVKNNQNEFCDNKEEVATTAYGGFNNCGVCNYYYCDKCRRNCFYEIEQRYTIRPPSPVQDAMIEFYVLYPETKNNENIESFECCEICWFRYYCRRCPHCGYTFCAQCNSEWTGCTKNWNDKVNIDHDDDNKFNDNNLVVEKHGKHENKYNKHSCLEAKAKMADIERKKKAKREKNKNELIQRLAKEKQEAEYEKKHQQYLFEKQRKELEEMSKQNAFWKAKALESENKKLEKEKNASQLNLKRTQIEKDKFRAKAEQEEKKAIQVEEENNKLRKRIGFITIWQYHDYGVNWKSYDYDTNKAIEKLKINEIYSYLCPANNQNYKITKTAKDNGIQINTKTNVQRNIKRKKIERGLNVIKYPQWWNMNDLQLESEPGSSSHSFINAMYAKPKLIKMNLNELPANDVVNKFYMTVKGYTIIKIECIQNQMLYDAYYGVRSKLLKLIGKKKLNEKKLFHGTRSENVMKLIENEGFRKEFNKTAVHGKGTYFARDASYSVGYSSCNNGIFKMFECNVLCGESHLGSGSFELNKWPKKSNGSGLIYDSLVDNKKTPSIFVIHDDLRAYPMFVIHFKKN